MTIFHTDECEAANARLRAEREAWEKRWPNYCRECEGFGGRTYSYDPSPAGVSLSSGTMQDFDPCEACGEHDLCPRCMKPLPDRKERAKRFFNHLLEYLWVTPRWKGPDNPTVWDYAFYRARDWWARNGWPVLSGLRFETKDWGQPPCRNCGWTGEGIPYGSNECEGCHPDYLARLEEFYDVTY